MTEAEIIYKLNELHIRKMNHYGNYAVRSKTQSRMNQLNYELRLNYSRWLNQYDKKEVDDLIAEHILLGENE